MANSYTRVAPKVNRELDCSEAPAALFHDASAALHAAQRMRRRCPLGISAKPDVRVHNCAPLLAEVLESILETA